MNAPPRMVEVRARILKENDILARGLRRRFEDAGVTVISFVSSPGSGKTMLLETLMSRLNRRWRVAALVGDLATENDAVRLGRACPLVKQIVTGTVCHLDAKMVSAALDEWKLDGLDFLFIENVGNLVCPANYDLGEAMRVVLLSVTEGEDKPLKYPLSLTRQTSPSSQRWISPKRATLISMTLGRTLTAFVLPCGFSNYPAKRVKGSMRRLRSLKAGYPRLVGRRRSKLPRDTWAAKSRHRASMVTMHTKFKTQLGSTA